MGRLGQLCSQTRAGANAAKGAYRGVSSALASSLFHSSERLVYVSGQDAYLGLPGHFLQYSPVLSRQKSTFRPKKAQLGKTRSIGKLLRWVSANFRSFQADFRSRGENLPKHAKSRLPAHFMLFRSKSETSKQMPRALQSAQMEDLWYRWTTCSPKSGKVTNGHRKCWISSRRSLM